MRTAELTAETPATPKDFQISAEMSRTCEHDLCANDVRFHTFKLDRTRRSTGSVFSFSDPSRRARPASFDTSGYTLINR